MTEPGRTLAGTRLLQGVDAERIQDLDRRCRWRTFEPDERILNLDDSGRDVFFIVRGEVRVTVFSETGKTVIMRDLKTGDQFGEYAAIDGAPRSASIVAMTRTMVAVVPQEMFLSLLSDYPALALTVMRTMSSAIRALNERVVEFSTLGVRNRIHAELLRLGRDGRQVENTARISPPPTHAEIAARISTHREAVTRELKQLERQGLLEKTRGALVVKDVEELGRMVDDARAGRDV
jgi:CRP/FNR family cyclic AMP-dependent transcriptional regulator